MAAPALSPSSAQVANLLIARLHDVGKATEQGGMKGLVQGATLITNVIKLSLALPHSGPIYGRGRNPASLPGEPPALQTGALRASYRWWPAGTNALFIGSSDPKAAYLEYGTSRMAPRPHFRTAILKSVPELTNLMQREVNKHMQEAIGRMKS